ncbi:unnamed protein product [Strongylus vulgaris]|uniref:Uncharacterized protein n=1 Tax=Strongylus vulgaris TaxID=40348 RepID=A0A3P7JUH5_STRVU|nr:unnamed protein product [Strongylus vulgaris]
MLLISRYDGREVVLTSYKDMEFGAGDELYSSLGYGNNVQYIQPDGINPYDDSGSRSSHMSSWKNKILRSSHPRDSPSLSSLNALRTNTIIDASRREAHLAPRMHSAMTDKNSTSMKDKINDSPRNLLNLASQRKAISRLGDDLANKDSQSQLFWKIRRDRQIIGPSPPQRTALMNPLIVAPDGNLGSELSSFTNGNGRGKSDRSRRAVAPPSQQPSVQWIINQRKLRGPPGRLQRRP